MDLKQRALAILTIIGILVAGPAAAQEKSHLHRILESGVLRVGTTGDWNPMTMRDTVTNSYKGFDIDLVTELARDLGVKVVFVPTEWKTIVNGIVADKYDVSTSASVTPGRIRVAGFTTPYFRVGSVPLTLQRNLKRFSGWASINTPEVSVAVTMGTSFEQQVKRFLPAATIKTVEAPARDYQEVLAGRALVSITSNLEAAKLVKTHPELAVIPVERPRSPADLALMVAQDDQVWLNYLNHWIAIKANRGFFDELRQNWIGAPQ